MNNNDTTHKLKLGIANAWEQLEKVVLDKDNRSTSGCRTHLEKITHLEALLRQHLALEESIELSISNTAANETAPLIPTSEHPTEQSPDVSTLFGRNGKRQTVRPKEIRIGTFRKVIHLNNEIPTTVADWITEQGKVIPNFPNFVHPSNAGFTSSASTKRLASGQYMDVGDHQERLLQKGRKLLDACGYSSLRIEVQLEDGSSLGA